MGCLDMAEPRARRRRLSFSGGGPPGGPAAVSLTDVVPLDMLTEISSFLPAEQRFGSLRRISRGFSGLPALPKPEPQFIVEYQWVVRPAEGLVSGYLIGVFTMSALPRLLQEIREGRVLLPTSLDPDLNRLTFQVAPINEVVFPRANSHLQDTFLGSRVGIGHYAVAMSSIAQDRQTEQGTRRRLLKVGSLHEITDDRILLDLWRVWERELLADRERQQRRTEAGAAAAALRSSDVLDVVSSFLGPSARP